jgi:tetratricopeptide (TPR) repeat protein
MIGTLIVKDKAKKIDIRVDLSRIETIAKEAIEFIQFEKDGFYKEVNRVLSKDEAGNDIVSTLNRLRDTLDGDGAITDLESFREGIHQIIDVIDYLSDLFAKHGLHLSAAKLGEVKLELPTPYEFSIPKDEMEIDLCWASRRIEVGRHYFTLGINIPKRKYFEKAGEHFREALPNLERYREDELAGQVHLALAIICNLLGEEEKSTGHFKGAISKFSKLRFDLSDEREKKGILKRAALIEIATSLMDTFTSKEDREPDRKHRLELALGNFRKAEPDHHASFIHFMALIETRDGYTWIRKRLPMESTVNNPQQN